MTDAGFDAPAVAQFDFGIVEATPYTIVDTDAQRGGWHISDAGSLMKNE
ncbi:hypothetical protein [Desulfatitalea alkaliphila]|uniref:Uncharacterized protein n=1 Tax=Desulfatitalea alkaliphila TaxID=2929485 RepID=A0AA41R743_9BACT|nr:hypothetical protein [Desulfatitalea alkaliphila]MCJ8502166.1 hypothetical protein [Desulfatitalea alkaliphila]